MKGNFKNLPLGKMVNVDGNNMHIFSEGQGDKTLVFMSGHSTACPTLDFKPLWSLLTDKYKIAVVEKFGYGWSDITKTPRDLDTVLANTREALNLAGIMPPYVLVPHSLSGLEAVYWAQKHPQEVTAIIWLDPSVPDVADVMKVSPLVRYVMGIMSKLARSGMNDKSAVKAIRDRFPSASYDSPSLTDSDKAAFVELFKRCTLVTSDMLQEMKDMEGNIKMIRSLPLPSNTPVYFFSSNFKEVAKQGRKPEEFLNFHKKFVSNFKTSKHTALDCGHYVHSSKPEKIANEIGVFLGEIEGV